MLRNRDRSARLRQNNPWKTQRRETSVWKDWQPGPWGLKSFKDKMSEDERKHSVKQKSSVGERQQSFKENTIDDETSIAEPLGEVELKAKQVNKRTTGVDAADTSVAANNTDNSSAQSAKQFTPRKFQRARLRKFKQKRLQGVQQHRRIGINRKNIFQSIKATPTPAKNHFRLMTLPRPHTTRPPTSTVSPTTSSELTPIPTIFPTIVPIPYQLNKREKKYNLGRKRNSLTRGMARREREEHEHQYQENPVNNNLFTVNKDGSRMVTPQARKEYQMTQGHLIQPSPDQIKTQGQGRKHGITMITQRRPTPTAGSDPRAHRNIIDKGKTHTRANNIILSNMKTFNLTNTRKSVLSNAHRSLVPVITSVGHTPRNLDLLTSYLRSSTQDATNAQKEDNRGNMVDFKTLNNRNIPKQEKGGDNRKKSHILTADEPRAVTGGLHVKGVSAVRNLDGHTQNINNGVAIGDRAEESFEYQTAADAKRPRVSDGKLMSSSSTKETINTTFPLSDEYTMQNFKLLPSTLGLPSTNRTKEQLRNENNISAKFKAAIQPPGDVVSDEADIRMPLGLPEPLPTPKRNSSPSPAPTAFVKRQKTLTIPSINSSDIWDPVTVRTPAMHFRSSHQDYLAPPYVPPKSKNTLVHDKIKALMMAWKPRLNQEHGVLTDSSDKPLTTLILSKDEPVLADISNTNNSILQDRPISQKSIIQSSHDSDIFTDELNDQEGSNSISTKSSFWKGVLDHGNHLHDARADGGERREFYASTMIQIPTATTVKDNVNHLDPSPISAAIPIKTVAPSNKPSTVPNDKLLTLLPGILPTSDPALSIVRGDGLTIHGDHTGMTPKHPRAIVSADGSIKIVLGREILMAAAMNNLKGSNGKSVTTKLNISIVFE